MSDLVERIKAAKSHRCPHPFPRAPGMQVTLAYIIREDEIDELISAISTAREEGRRKGLGQAETAVAKEQLALEAAMRVMAPSEKSLSRHAETLSAMTAAIIAIRTLKEKQP